MTNHITRRRFLAGTTALGASALLGAPGTSHAEPPPEISRVRIANVGALCFAPQFVADALLRQEGFTDVQYVKVVNSIPETLTSAADFAMFGGPSVIPAIDKGLPVKVLTGLHEGCWELFAREPINSLMDLRGRTVGTSAFGSVDHVFLSSMLAYVGIDPNTEIKWVETKRWGAAKELFLQNKVEVFLAFPPEPQELRAMGERRVIVDTTHDRPWSQYFCCMLGGRNEFITQYPVATKRALRAVLKAADLCTEKPDVAARYLVDRGYAGNYNFALETLTSLSYRRWRTDDAANTLLFYSLRLRDVGMIKSLPQEIVERGTDFSFLNELKKELKA